MEKINKEFILDVDFINESIKKLEIDKDSKILDIGTGFGIMAIILAIKGFNVLTGEPEVEFETDDLDHHYEHNHEHQGALKYDWRETARAVGVENKIKYQNFYVQDLPFVYGSIDAIFLYDTLQHVKNREGAIIECLRVLKGHGFIGVIEWNEKQIEVDYKKYGFKIDFIDPRDIIHRDDISIEIFKGDLVNMYILRKNVS